MGINGMNIETKASGVETQNSTTVIGSCKADGRTLPLDVTPQRLVAVKLSDCPVDSPEFEFEHR